MISKSLERELPPDARYYAMTRQRLSPDALYYRRLREHERLQLPRRFPPRTKVSYPKAMTIAAGFVAGDGLLLCADTLHTDGQTKEYRDKIFTYTGKYAAVMFAGAGNSGVARMVIDDCRDALDNFEKSKLTTREILRKVRPIIKRDYEDYVDSRPPEERVAADFNLLVGIATATERPRLYATARAALSRVDTFECIGMGRPLGRYIIEPTYRSEMSVDEVAVLGIHALAAAKERIDGVGGRSQFLSIRNGILSPVVSHDVNLSEAYVLEFRQASNRLLGEISDRALEDDDFKDRLADFSSTAEKLRALWKGGAAPWDFLLKSLNKKSYDVESNKETKS